MIRILKENYDPNNYIYEGGPAPTDVVNAIVKDGVTTIEYSAFEDCKSLKSIVIPNSVKEIGSSTFCNCKSLKSIVIPNSVTTIGSFAFDGCKSLKSIVIPNSVTTIRNDTFYGCISLESIVIPNSIKEIGNEAFCNCKSLKSIVIPNSVTTIGYSTFKNCISLESIVIPNSVKEIGKNTFDNCKSLKPSDIPDSFREISPFHNSQDSTKSMTISKNVKKNNKYDKCSNGKTYKYMLKYVENFCKKYKTKVVSTFEDVGSIEENLIVATKLMVVTKDVADKICKDYDIEPEYYGSEETEYYASEYVEVDGEEDEIYIEVGYYPDDNSIIDKYDGYMFVAIACGVEVWNEGLGI